MRRAILIKLSSISAEWDVWRCPMPRHSVSAAEEDNANCYICWVPIVTW